MFNLKPKSEKTELQKVRTDAIAELEHLSAESDEYKKIMKHVKVLSELIDAETPSAREKLSPNTVTVILGNAGIAALVLWFERENVMNTKLFPFMTKAKS